MGRLILCWNDELAGELLADNVDADEPLPRRRQQLAAYRESLGPLEPDAEAGIESTSPAHCSWWLRGPRGRVRVEIRLTPQRPPRVQTLIVTPVPNPPASLRELAERLAADLAEASRTWPAGMRPAVELDDDHVRRQLQVGAVWAGRCRVAEVLASDGRREASFRLAGERASLILTVTRNPISKVVTAVNLTLYPSARS